MEERTSMRGRVSISGTALKFIGLAAMTADHIGYLIFPSVLWLRIVGRIAWPLFAYMIAEGCRYTRHKCRYWSLVAWTALLCSAAEYIAEGSLYQSVMVTFTFSISMIFALQGLRESVVSCFGEDSLNEGNFIWRKVHGGFFDLIPAGRFLFYAVLSAALLAAAFVLGNAPEFFPETKFRIDYGFWGIMTSVFVWAGRDRREKLFLLSAGLFLTAYQMGGIQYFSFLSLPLLIFYKGKRGKYSLKYFFYLYYPLHLAALYGIVQLCL